MGIRRKMPIRIPYGEVLVVALSSCLISYQYIDYPEGFKDNYLKILDQLIGNI